MSRIDKLHQEQVTISNALAAAERERGLLRIKLSEAPDDAKLKAALADVKRQIADYHSQAEDLESAMRAALDLDGEDALNAKETEIATCITAANKAAQDGVALAATIQKQIAALGAALKQYDAFTSTCADNVRDAMILCAWPDGSVVAPRNASEGNLGGAFAGTLYAAGVGQIGFTSGLIEIGRVSGGLSLAEAAKLNADKLAGYLEQMRKRLLEKNAEARAKIHRRYRAPIEQSEADNG